MSIEALYTKGAKVWLQDPVEVWRVGEILEDLKAGVLKIQLDNAVFKELIIRDVSDLPWLRNPEFLIGGNDLTSLSYLHEPAVLHSLRVRFINSRSIYTYCGIVLVAVNPYQELPIYDQDTVLAYRNNKNSYGGLDPHIFAVAEEAYTKMERENKDQSIIVSGESGAGKTNSARYAMRYVAIVGGSATETQIERKVLASNPIMEAIGNAKTTRNDNSSRFGKYIELAFNPQYTIQGAGMRTYLLEKSRVVYQSEGERNYHIFYQLCAASSLPEMKYLELDHQDAFAYTSYGGCPTINGVDDLAEFKETRKALSILGFNDDQQAELFRVFAAVLHLGNVSFVEIDSETSGISKTDSHLAIFCKLMGLEPAVCDDLRKWLCFRQILTGREHFTKPMTKTDAAFARDALAKHIYSLLFQRIVSMVNKSLANPNRAHRFIGVLDIYGFETFQCNSFEQFCINYANEKLQQQFNLHVFKLDQEEYLREHIQWAYIDYYDNQPCIDLIEKQLGILDLLDEECRVPKGSDQSWVEKLHEKCKKFPQFEKPRLNKSGFIIKHFADSVEYQCHGFVEKNRDTVLEEQIEVLRTSTNSIVKQMMEEESIAASRSPAANAAGSRSVVGTLPRGGGNLLAPPGKQTSNTMTKKNRKTVGSQFRDSLTMLMNTLNQTTPHYVRCIKPNDDKAAFAFNPKRVVEQLRACGVLETVRISAAGFPSRLTYEEFVVRYRVMFHSRQLRDRNDLRIPCEAVLNSLITGTDKFKFGATKIFFRAGQVAYLEKNRTDKLRACGTLIQRMVRGWFYRKRYLVMYNAVIRLQCLVLGYLARRKAQFLRETRAAIIIQRKVRIFNFRRRMALYNRAALSLQTYGRGYLARRRYLAQLHHNKAIIIQKMVRGFLARRRFQRAKKGIVLLQSCWRRWRARRLYRALRAEARSIEHVRNLNKGLENKIISMQQKIEEMNKELIPLRNKQSEYPEMRAQLESFRGQAAELKAANGRIGELERLVLELRAQIDRERDEKMDLVQEREKMENEKRDLSAELSDVKKQLVALAESTRTKELETEDLIKRRLDQERDILAKEYEQERSRYQKLLQEKDELEEQKEKAERELEQLRNGGSEMTRGHARNTSTASNGTISFSSELNHEGDSGDITRPSSAQERMENGDVALIIKLRKRLHTLEKEREDFRSRVEQLERESPTEEIRRVQHSYRLEELEIENSRIKEDLKILRHQTATDCESQLPHARDTLLAQFEAMSDELDRRREECIQLRTILANTTIGAQLVDQTGLNVSRLNGGEPFVEDNEIMIAVDSLRRIIRHLENELQEEKNAAQRKIEEERLEIARLREDLEQKSEILAGAINRSPQSQAEAVMQHEITRLTADNLEAKEKYDRLAEQLNNHKVQLKKLERLLKQAGMEVPIEMPQTSQQALQEVQEVQEIHKRDKSESLPVARKKDYNYLGMFEYAMGDEKLIIRNLVYDLKPRLASTLLPGLPAYIMFMCIRHADHVNSDDKIRSFLTTLINGIRRLIKKKHEDLETSVFWLANTCRLLHCLRQYSGEKTFQEHNSPLQNEQCLRNFDLSEYRQVLSDLAYWIYQAVIKYMEQKVQPFIVPAILENDTMNLQSSHKQPGGRARSGSTKDGLLPFDPQAAFKSLLYELTSFYSVFLMFSVDPIIMAQAFRQVFYYICACALNNLLLRRDKCHWSSGCQIRVNICMLEQWIQDHNMGGPETAKNIEDTLLPLIQACTLLQDHTDVAKICASCTHLTIAQIIKILNDYTPRDESESRIPVTFISQVREELLKRPDAEAQATTHLMDTKFAYVVRFPFSPSSIKLENLDVPSVLNLSMLKKI